MTPPDLAAESRCFARYLLGVEPTPYVAAKYADAHRIDPAYDRGDAVDRWLLRIAVRSPARAWLADAYARLVRPRGLLRRKLVLMLAILETTAPAHRALELARPPGARRALVTLVRHGVVASLAAAAALLVLGPAHLAVRWRARR